MCRLWLYMFDKHEHKVIFILALLKQLYDRFNKKGRSPCERP